MHKGLIVSGRLLAGLLATRRLSTSTTTASTTTSSTTSTTTSSGCERVKHTEHIVRVTWLGTVMLAKIRASTAAVMQKVLYAIVAAALKAT